MTPDAAWLLANRPGTGYLADDLNEGVRSGFKAGDRVEFRDGRGRKLSAEIWDKGPKNGEWWAITATGHYVLIKAKRPALWGRPSLRPRAPRRAVRRDARGRFAA